MRKQKPKKVTQNDLPVPDTRHKKKVYDDGTKKGRSMQHGLARLTGHVGFLRYSNVGERTVAEKYSSWACSEQNNGAKSYWPAFFPNVKRLKISSGKLQVDQET